MTSARVVGRADIAATSLLVAHQPPCVDMCEGRRVGCSRKVFRVKTRKAPVPMCRVLSIVLFVMQPPIARERGGYERGLVTMSSCVLHVPFAHKWRQGYKKGGGGQTLWEVPPICAWTSVGRRGVCPHIVVPCRPRLSVRFARRQGLWLGETGRVYLSALLWQWGPKTEGANGNHTTQ